jgi:hypothetical protein
MITSAQKEPGGKVNAVAKALGIFRKSLYLKRRCMRRALRYPAHRRPGDRVERRHEIGLSFTALSMGHTMTLHDVTHAAERITELAMLHQRRATD